jgi:tyrosinase
MTARMPMPAHPTWDNAIAGLFAQPYWIPEQRQASVATQWNGCMSGFLIELDKYASVKEWSVTIYDHLYSRAMPLTLDPSQFWPDGALELLRTWINEGCRENDEAPLGWNDIIPPSHNRPQPLRIRKDIRDLSAAELDTYRMKLDDVMRVADASADSPWQKLAYIHTNWCLHYQEAFLPWHRASLLHLEHLIDFPIPYWNWYAWDASIDGSPNAGIPQAFKDETYVHPASGEVRRNPLRFAAAKDGKSKACQMPGACEALPPGACYWVQRDPLLYTSGDDQREARQKKIGLVRLFQEQVRNALRWPRFSQPEGAPGYPWANIQQFDPPQPDSEYPNREDFDGLYEQPHDNFHGWLGIDMADNSYTAFDPIFWSYHANIDRVMEIWLRQHPAATFTARFPIQPFIGPRAEAVDFTDRRSYRDTTIGDLVRDSRALGFGYAPTHSPDFPGPILADAPVQSPEAASLYVVFSDVRCTHDSYAIDAFLNLDAPALTDVDAAHPHYVGRFMRLGMGVADDKGRCITRGVTRVLDARRNVRALELRPDALPRLSLLVTDATTGRSVPESEWRKLPGFGAALAWGEAPAPAREPAPSGTCCHAAAK